MRSPSRPTIPRPSARRSMRSASRAIATMTVSLHDDTPQTGGPRKPGPGDPRNLVAAAEAARGRGDLEKAQTLYSAALDRNPADTEALNGLAAIAQARGDMNGAKASY